MNDEIFQEYIKAVKEREEVQQKGLSMFIESPARVGMNIGFFDDSSINYSFTNRAKTTYDKIAKYKDFEVYRNITPDAYTDVWVYKNAQFFCLFVAFNLENNTMITTSIWQRPDYPGVARDIILNFYLKQYNLKSDKLHTTEGEYYWKKLIPQAIQQGYKVYVLKGDKQEHFDMNNWEDYYKSENIQFLISK